MSVKQSNAWKDVGIEMTRNMLLSTFAGTILLGCIPTRDYLSGGGTQAICNLDIAFFNITNQFALAGYRCTAQTTNNILVVNFNKRAVHGFIAIDRNTFRPNFTGDLIDSGVNYRVEATASWLAPNDAEASVRKIINRAFELSKGDLYEIGRGRK